MFVVFVYGFDEDVESVEGDDYVCEFGDCCEFFGDCVGIF